MREGGRHFLALYFYILQVNKPPGRFRHKKTCYFIKSAPGKIDAENIKKIVRPWGLNTVVSGFLGVLALIR